MDMQTRELENNFDKRCEEINSYLRELQHISSLREKVEKELEQVVL